MKALAALALAILAAACLGAPAEISCETITGLDQGGAIERLRQLPCEPPPKITALEHPRGCEVLAEASGGTVHLVLVGELDCGELATLTRDCRFIFFDRFETGDLERWDRAKGTAP